jgi:anti-sigma-K factor RskA/putative zinc finger protein
METDLHDLTAAYALDALDEEELRAYEEHLASCERCREELAELAVPATALAYGVESPAPPAALRDRILETARAERPNVVPLRPRVLWTTGTLAAAAACAAIGVGIWATSLSRSLDRERSAARRVSSVVADPAAQRVSLSNGHGSLYVAPTGTAALALARLKPAPHGKTYEAWVADGGRPRRAGTFGGGGAAKVVTLDRRVTSGSRVMVTIERAGGVSVPTGAPLFIAKV